MKNVFFIIGLPRSRTCWLANFFTYGNSFCYHELSKICYSKPEKFNLLVDTIKNNEAEFVGISDSGLPIMLDSLMIKFPKAKIVVIERDKNEVVESLKSFLPKNRLYKFDKTMLIDDMADCINILKGRHKCMTVSFNSLDDKKVVKQMWEYCVDTPWNDERFNMLDLMNVQVDNNKYLKELKAWIT